MVAARIANIRQGARTDLSPIGEKSQDEAAELLNVHATAVLAVDLFYFDRRFF
jgi:hypothetical protein